MRKIRYFDLTWSVHFDHWTKKFILQKALVEVSSFSSCFFSLWTVQRIKSKVYWSPFLRKLLGIWFVQLQHRIAKDLIFFFLFFLEAQGIQLCWNSIAIEVVSDNSFHMVKRLFSLFLMALFGLEEQNCFLFCWL